MSDAAKPLFDRKALVRNRDRAARLIEDADFLLSEVEGSFEDRLGAINRSFASIAIIGAWDGRFGHLVERRYAPQQPVHQIEFSSEMAKLSGSELFVGDTLPIEPASLDLILCPLVLQSVEDIPGALIQMRRALKPDGLLLASMLCADSLGELRQAVTIGESETVNGISPRIAPMADLRDLGGLLQRAGLALPVADKETLTVRYGNPLRLLHDLRAMGMSNPMAERRRVFFRRDTLARTLEAYAQNATKDGKALATFDIAYLHGWAPHDSQQQPLRPGSAKTRLADALGTSETSLRDNPND